METSAVILNGPKDLSVDVLSVADPSMGDIVVDVSHSGISTGTEKLFWSGDMPPFPGMGFPLVPGYEATGEVVEAGALTGFKSGDRVFVPGANCYDDAFGLFGGASNLLVTDSARAVRIDSTLNEEGALFALAATAFHVINGSDRLPDLIVGHGTLGRLLARITVARGGTPTVWEINPARQFGADGYYVVSPDADTAPQYDTIIDATGQASLLPTLIGKLTKGGEIVLAGFYSDPISFAFPPAFMKEARLRVAAEWVPSDLRQTREAVEAGTLSLSGLITHRAKAADAARAYETAFSDDSCLKMILDWKGHV